MNIRNYLGVNVKGFLVLLSIGELRTLLHLCVCESNIVCFSIFVYTGMYLCTYVPVCHHFKIKNYVNYFILFSL